MAALNTYAMATNREDLSDALEVLGVKETPLYSGLSKVSAMNTIHEWSTEDLDTVATNAAVEGFAYSYSAPTVPTRLANYTQIFNKQFQVTNTQEAMNPAGMKNSYSHAVEVKMKSILRDVESALINGTANSGATGTGRRLKGALAWITSNIDSGTGTATVLTAANLNSLLKDIADAGGNPDTILVSGTQKVKVSGLSSSNRRFVDDSKKFTQAIDVYESDFGLLQVKYDRWVPTSTLMVMEMPKWRIAQLRPISKEDTARVADGVNGVIVGELTLESLAPSYNGKMTRLAV